MFAVFTKSMNIGDLVNAAFAALIFAKNRIMQNRDGTYRRVHVMNKQNVGVLRIFFELYVVHNRRNTD